MTRASRLKIVNLGLPKTGTTTLARALREAGLFAADHRVREDDTTDRRVRNTFVALSLYAGWYEDGDPLGRLTFFDALTEISALRPPLSLFPQCDYPVLKAMRDRHPEIKFVATTRPSEDVCESMDNWRDLGRRIADGTIPGLPHGYGADLSERIHWIESTLQTQRDVFAGRDNFLELDVGAPDAQEQLSDFLGLALPWWGRENANPKRKRHKVA